MNRLEKIRLAYGSTLMDGGYTLWSDGKKRDKGFVVGGVARSGREGICDRDDTTEFARLDFNPCIGLGLEELELAYAYYSWCGDTDAIHMVADAFCLEAELEVFGGN